MIKFHLSTRLLRVLFLTFLTQQLLFSANTKTVDAAYFDFQQKKLIDSCKDHGINAGETLDADCIDYCRPNPYKTYDVVNLEEDPNFVVRDTVCRCYEYGTVLKGNEDKAEAKTFECWSKAEVWDKKKPIMKCEEHYGIISLSTCQDFCKRIDPKAFEYDGFAGSSECSCGGFQVCSDGANTSSAGKTDGSTASIIMALVTVHFLALLS